MDVGNWKKLEEEAFKFGFRRMLRRVYQLPDGRTGEFYVVDGGRVVCIVALTPENNIVLAKQYRPGPDKVLLELPGGGLEGLETPEEGARRELLEETGYNGDLQFIGTCVAGGYSTMVKYNFVATNCQKVQEPKLDEYEFIETVEMPLAEFRQHLRSGELTDVATAYLGLDFLGLLT